MKTTICLEMMQKKTYPLPLSNYHLAENQLSGCILTFYLILFKEA